MLQSNETIRATVVGAGSHTAEISGSTIAYREQILPIKNIPILKLAKEDEELAASEWSERIREKLKWHTTEGHPKWLWPSEDKIRLLTTFSDMERNRGRFGQSSERSHSYHCYGGRRYG